MPWPPYALVIRDAAGDHALVWAGDTLGEAWAKQDVYAALAGDARIVSLRPVDAPAPRAPQATKRPRPPAAAPAAAPTPNPSKTPAPSASELLATTRKETRRARSPKRPRSQRR